MSLRYCTNATRLLRLPSARARSSGNLDLSIFLICSASTRVSQSSSPDGLVLDRERETHSCPNSLHALVKFVEHATLAEHGDVVVALLVCVQVDERVDRFEEDVGRRSNRGRSRVGDDRSARCR